MQYFALFAPTLQHGLKFVPYLFACTFVIMKDWRTQVSATEAMKTRSLNEVIFTLAKSISFDWGGGVIDCQTRKR